MQDGDSIILGDCREVLKSIPNGLISCCLTDPPYNYEFIGHKWDHDEIQRRISRVKGDSKTLVKNIPYGSGLAGGVRNEKWYVRNRQNRLQYMEWIRQWGSELFRVCRPGATVGVFNSTRSVAHVQMALEEVGFYARDILVWRRSSGIPKGLNLKSRLSKIGEVALDAEGKHSALRNEWEAVAILQKPLETNYVETFKKYGTGLFQTTRPGGGFQSNILEGYALTDSDKFDVHCTVKPLALMERLVEILAPTGEDHVVIDPFAGTGTTLVAARNRGRKFLGIEINPQYIPLAKKRLSAPIAQLRLVV